MGVGADREQLCGHRTGPAADRHVRDDRRDVGPQRAGVDELAGEQPLDVGAPASDDLAGHDRDHVGGRAPAVEQDRVGHRARDQQRRRHPVRGGALERRGPRVVEADELTARGDHAQRAPGQRPSRGLEHVQHPLALARERVDELGGRGERDRCVLDLEPPDHRGDRARQRIRAAPHLERLRGDADAVVGVDDRRLGVGAADVEADHRDHQGIMTGTMRIVPVLDLKGGIVVHARRGRRAEYAPLRSPLVERVRARRRRASAVRGVPDPHGLRRRSRRARGQPSGRGDAGGARGGRRAVGRCRRDHGRAGGGAGSGRRSAEHRRHRVARAGEAGRAIPRRRGPAAAGAQRRPARRQTDLAAPRAHRP